jgi:sortase A
MSEKHRTLRVLQWILIVAGLALLGFWLGARIEGALGQDSEIRRFETARQELRDHPAAQETTPAAAETLAGDLPVDTSLWAEDRIEEYEASLIEECDAPLAILRIPRINLEVAVLEGTSELVLNRGVGHITGTATPGGNGNVGIAGHRDGYFRGLKDVARGDLIELETLTGTEDFTITELLLVDPPDVWVLEPTDVPSVTLVTCYPFYYVGSAPQRYIVRAEHVPETKE